MGENTLVESRTNFVVCWMRRTKLILSNRQRLMARSFITCEARDVRIFTRDCSRMQGVVVIAAKYDQKDKKKKERKKKTEALNGGKSDEQTDEIVGKVGGEHDGKCDEKSSENGESGELRAHRQDKMRNQGKDQCQIVGRSWR